MDKPSHKSAQTQAADILECIRAQKHPQDCREADLAGMVLKNREGLQRCGLTTKDVSKSRLDRRCCCRSRMCPG